MIKPIAFDYETDVEIALRHLLDCCFDDLERRQVVPAIGNLNSGLRAVRDALEPDVWKTKVTPQVRSHPILARLHESPLSSRSFGRPRGYPGDAVTIDYVYGYESPTQSTDLGKDIFDYEFHVQGCASVRLRRAIVRRRLEQLFSAAPDAQVLSIAAGHLRELDEYQLAQLAPPARIVALDQDGSSLDLVRRRLSSAHVVPIRSSLKELFLHSIELDQFDFIYSMGLLDYLDRRTASSLVRYCVKHLKPGGQLLLANFAPSLFDIAYMEAVMHWWLIYRNENEMVDLLQNVSTDEYIHRTFRDHHQNIVYLEVTRAGR